MWTLTYLLLLMVRLYFAISPSYIHPDENFQGPEVIAGQSLAVALGSCYTSLLQWAIRRQDAQFSSPLDLGVHVR